MPKSVKRRRRLPPRQLQRAVWPPRRPGLRARLARLGRQAWQEARALDEHLVLALEPCARICRCSDPGRHLRRERLLPPAPRLPSGWRLLDQAGVRLGLLDRRPRWRTATQLRAVRTALLLVLAMGVEVLAAAVLSSVADARKASLETPR